MIATTRYDWYDRMEPALRKMVVWREAPRYKFHEVYERQISHALRECDAGSYEGCILIDFHSRWRNPIMLIGTKKAVLINPGYVYPYGSSFEFIVMRVMKSYSVDHQFDYDFEVQRWPN